MIKCGKNYKSHQKLRIYRKTENKFSGQMFTLVNNSFYMMFVGENP